MSLQIGAAEVDITPKLGTHLAGDICNFRPADRVLDPLYARVLVAQTPPRDGKSSGRVCLLTLDLCTIGDESGEAIRRRLADEFGFEPDAIVIHLMQNHSAPALGTHLFLRPDSPYVKPDYWWVYQGDPAYFEFLLPRLSDAVRQALQKLEPASGACGGIAEGGLSFNRRFVMRDGWIQSQPVGDNLCRVLCPEGPADPEVGVAGFRNRKGRWVAALLHHTGHPVSLFGTNTVTASWPGAWVREFRGLVDPGCVVMVVNGCCGNVNMHNSIEPDERRDDAAIGCRLTRASGKVLVKLRFEEEIAVGHRARRLNIPFGSVRAQIGEEGMARARALLEREPEARWRPGSRTTLDTEWLFAASILDLDRRLVPGSVYPYLLQTLRIGSLGLVALVGEPFVEGQLEIKKQSPFSRTFVAHMCSGYIGYIPPRSSYEARNLNFRTPDGHPVRRGGQPVPSGAGRAGSHHQRSLAPAGRTQASGSGSTLEKPLKNSSFLSQQ